MIGVYVRLSLPAWAAIPDDLLFLRFPWLRFVAALKGTERLKLEGFYSILFNQV
jgi:hypothetical protein